MKLYILFHASKWQTWGVIGVYSTFDYAEKAMQEHDASTAYSTYKIRECTLDSEPIQSPKRIGP